MKKVFQREAVFTTNLFLTFDEHEKTKSSQTNLEIELVGQFKRNGYREVNVICHYDEFFKCYKSDLV